MNTVRILVVDDEPDIRDILEKALSMSGHIVTTAEDGVTAIAQCQSFKPDVVLLDVMMPNGSGLETLQRIHEIDPSAKVIMVSGMHDLQVAKEAMRLGAVDYLTKPFDLRELDSFIRSQMSATE